MRLKISRKTLSEKVICERGSYSAKEILENLYPELVEQVEEHRHRLGELQSRVRELLPTAKEHLPATKGITNAELHSATAQANIQAYITLRSLYGFAIKAQLQIYNMCEGLAKAINGDKSVSEEDAHANLKEFLGRLSAMYDQYGPALFENLGVVGLLRMQHIADYMGAKYNLYDFSAVGSWTFRDVVGSVISRGYFGMDLILEAYSRSSQQ